jgi:hypothetical protein
MKISLEKIKQKAIESSEKNHIKNDYFEYFINGVKLKKDDWEKNSDRIKYLRYEKLKRLLND